MRILTSYLIRAHAGPFIFALSTLTALLFLNAVAQRLEDLAGKGLTGDVIWEFLVLSLPHTIALTLPMAVLVAVLYAFSELTAHNEITAMKAGGVRPQRAMLPLLGMGVIIGGVMLMFNDRVLPESNHRLKNLLLDINRKSPTFILREQVVNPIRSSESGDVYYLTAAGIDNQTNELTDVAIYDASDPLSTRTTYAERGHMAFNRDRTDLYLTLYDGMVLETGGEAETSFQQMAFAKQILPLRGVGNEMVRRAGGSERSDREMTLAMLDSAATNRETRLDSVRAASHARTRSTVLLALGRDIDPPPLPEVSPEDTAGRGSVDHDSFGRDSVGRDSVAGATDSAAAGLPQRRARVAPAGRAGGPGAQDRRGAPAVGPGAPDRAGRASARIDEEQGLLGRDNLTREAYVSINTDWAVANAHRDRMNAYRVEIHKKYTLAFACVVFVLMGGPLAIRFPRGGLGLVIAASSGIFAVYWAGLIGGENLADSGWAPPAVTMWLPNIVFTALGLWLFFSMGRESATSRGGGWEDLYWTVRKAITPGRGRRAPGSVRPATGRREPSATEAEA